MAAFRRKSLKSPAIFFGTLILCLFMSRLAFACPMCSDIVGRGKDALASMRFGNGIGWSIVVMLAMPFSIIGMFAWTIVRSQKQKQAGVKAGK